MPYRPFGDAPVSIPQEVRASPPNPSQANLPPSAPVAQLLAKKMAARAVPRTAPTSNRQGLQTQRPFAPARVFQAGGMSGAPIQATNINGAPVAVDPVPRAGSLGAMNVDTSVSAQMRAAKALRADGVPVTGAYTSAIRSAAGGFAPPRMPKQGYMAASYSYPSRAMVVGATLSGVPIINAQPVMGVSPAPAPRLVVRERGQGPRNQVSSSPSEDRRRMLSTLMGFNGLGAGIFDTLKKQTESLIAKGQSRVDAQRACEAGGDSREACSKMLDVRVCMDNSGQSGSDCQAQYDSKTGFFKQSAPSSGSASGGTGNATLDAWLNQNPMVKSAVALACPGGASISCVCGQAAKFGITPPFCPSSGGSSGGGTTPGAGGGYPGGSGGGYGGGYAQPPASSGVSPVVIGAGAAVLIGLALVLSK